MCRSGPRKAFLCLGDIERHLLLFSLDTGTTDAGLFQSGFERFEARAQFGVIAMGARNACLSRVALLFGGANLRTQRGDLMVELAHARIRRRTLLAQTLQPVFALEHTGVDVAAAIHAKPIAAQPFSCRSDQRLTGLKL